MTNLSHLSGAGAPPKEPLTRGISTLGELWELRGCGRGLWESSRSCGRALGEVWELSGRGVGVGEWWEGVGRSGELWNDSGRAVGWEWNARLTRSTADGSADGGKEWK